MNTKNDQTDYENNQPNSQNLHNQDNQQNQQNPYDNQPYIPQQPYGYQNNQNEFNMRLASTAKISIVYITLYIISVFFFFIACILVVTSATGFNVNLGQIFAAIGLFCVGGVFCFVNFILSIVLAAKVNVLSKFSRKFSAPFILFVIGIFFNLLSLIASFMTLSRTKNTKDTQPNSQNLHNRDNQQSKQDSYGYQNEYNNPPNYNPHYQYSNQPYRYQNNQKIFEKHSTSTANISIACISFYFVSVVSLLFGCATIGVNLINQSVYYSQGIYYQYILSGTAVAYLVMGCISWLVNFILTIMLVLKVNYLNQFSTEFSTPFIFFIIGIFFNLFSVIAAFMILPIIKKAKQPIPNND